MPVMLMRQSALRWPSNSIQLFRQLFWVHRIYQLLVECLAGLQLLLGSADDEPEHLRLRIVEHLTQLVRSDKHSPMLWDRECLISDANAPDAFNHKIEFFHLGMPVERVGTLRRKPPKSGSQNLALGSLKKIRI